ncbi:MAG TPA: pilus assembly PilX N-terminal domain-containing protein [Gaiellaceae bacterium]
MVRLPAFFVRARARFASQEGMALIVALGAMMVLGITGTTLVYYSTANTRSAGYSKASATSFQLAEAGLHEALSVLTNQPANDPTSPTLLATRTSAYSTGNVTWGGTYDSSTAKWTITSTGQVANPANVPPSQAVRTISAKVPVYPVNTQQLAFNAWNYVYSWGTGDPSGCDMTMESSQDVSTRVMVAGNLCMSSSSQLYGAQTHLTVGGQLKVFSSAHVGSSGSPILRADVGNGCKYESNAVHSPCGSADKVWASTITTSPQLEPVPTLDLNSWYTKASPGPYHPCETASGGPPVFDNDQGSTPDFSKRNRSLAGSFDLTKSGSYTCRTMIGSEVFGELSWNDSTNVLTVKGTIFIDGNAKITQSARYTGQATIYLSGSLLVSGRMCAVISGSNCNYSSGVWDPNTALLTIVANGGGGQSDVDTSEAIALISSSQWQGALYGGSGLKVQVESSTDFAGPIIADEVSLKSSIDTMPFGLITTAPTGMPGNSTINAQPDKPQLFSG